MELRLNSREVRERATEEGLHQKEHTPLPGHSAPHERDTGSYSANSDLSRTRTV